MIPNGELKQKTVKNDKMFSVCFSIIDENTQLKQQIKQTKEAADTLEQVQPAKTT